MAPANPAACPSCGLTMESLRFARHVHGDVALDICWSCHVMWFDQYESAQLTPGAVLALFRDIHEHRAHPPRPLGASLRCPRCTVMLVPTHDIQKNTRLHYLRCPENHGRLTTFMQFLREKSFVRPLSPQEIERLRASVSQVRCSSCGAAVNVAHDATCQYCRAPLAMLDAEAVDRALASLSAAERERTDPPPARTDEAFDALLAAYKKSSRVGTGGWTRNVMIPGTTGGLVDLMVEGLQLLFE